MQEFFVITKVSRADLEKAGFDVSDVDDITMKYLARKMGEFYGECGFWDDLAVIANNLCIPRK